MYASRADNLFKNRRNLPISNPKPDLLNNYTHTKFGKNPLTFTIVNVWKRKYGQTDGRQAGGQTTDDGRASGQTNGHTNNQRETIIHRHYRVEGYKNDDDICRKKTASLLLCDNTVLNIFLARFRRTGPGISFESSPQMIRIKYLY